MEPVSRIDLWGALLLALFGGLRQDGGASLAPTEDQAAAQAWDDAGYRRLERAQGADEIPGLAGAWVPTAETVQRVDLSAAQLLDRAAEGDVLQVLGATVAESASRAGLLEFGEAIRLLPFGPEFPTVAQTLSSTGNEALKLAAILDAAGHGHVAAVGPAGAPGERYWGIAELRPGDSGSVTPGEFEGRSYQAKQQRVVAARGGVSPAAFPLAELNELVPEAPWVFRGRSSSARHYLDAGAEPLDWSFDADSAGLWVAAPRLQSFSGVWGCVRPPAYRNVDLRTLYAQVFRGDSAEPDSEVFDLEAAIVGALPAGLAPTGAVYLDLAIVGAPDSTGARRIAVAYGCEATPGGRTPAPPTADRPAAPRQYYVGVAEFGGGREPSASAPMPVEVGGLPVPRLQLIPGADGAWSALLDARLSSPRRGDPTQRLGIEFIEVRGEGLQLRRLRSPLRGCWRPDLRRAPKVNVLPYASGDSGVSVLCELEPAQMHPSFALAQLAPEGAEQLLLRFELAPE